MAKAARTVTPADYNTQIITTSMEALRRSRELLDRTECLVTATTEMTSTAGSDLPVRGVDDVLITAELASRPTRDPGYETESRALRLLAQEMATNPGGVLQKCAELVMELCHADSAGISILEPGGTSGIFRWHAAAGGFAPNLHGTMPREASPCGTVIERNRVLLFKEAERFFPALRGVEPRIYENLLAPWHVRGEAVGTLWVIRHTPEGRFDAEDARVLQSLARFAAAAFQMTSVLDEAIAERTELEQRTKALQASETRLQAAINLVGLSPYTWDPATGALEWDARLKAMWGLPPDAHVDHEVWLSGIHPEDRAQVDAALAHCVDPAGDGLYHIDYRVIGIGDGVERWVSTHGHTTFDNGQPVGFTGVALEITERKRAEATLRESEAKLALELAGARQLQQISSELIPEQRPETLYEQILAAMMAIMRSQAASMQILDPDAGTLKLMASQGFHPDAAAFWQCVDAGSASACGEALKTGRRILVSDIEACEFMAGTEDLEAYRRSNLRAVQSTPLRSRTGRTLGMVSTHWRKPHEPGTDDFSRFDVLTRQAADLIERSQTEAALRESEERFRQFAENSRNVLWILNFETMNLEYLSPAFEAIWGETIESTLGDPSRWSRFIHPDDQQRVSDALERVRLGDISTEEFRIIRQDRVVRWIRDTFFPMRDAHGRIRRVGGIAQDITRHDGHFVYVVDADEPSRQYLTRGLRSAGYDVRAFPSDKAFLQAAPALAAGCVVLDIRQPEAGGLTIPRELKARRIGLPVIVLGELQSDVKSAVQVMKAGAVDFLPVPYAPDELLAALASAAADISQADEQGQEANRARGRIAEMPVREREVLEGLLAGQTNKQIGRDIGISPRTVETHRAHVMQRLGARTIPELVRIAALAGVHARG